MARRDDDPRQRHLRRRVAQEAARLLAETGSDDVAHARRKAGARLGIRDEASLPGSAEILEALREHRAAEQRAVAPDALQRRREAAVEAMEFFADLDPRAVGRALADDSSDDMPVRLHLHADDPDAVARRLLERGIPARQSTRAVRLARDQRVDVPAWRFEAGGIPFELVQLPLSALRQSPRDPLDDAPLERATLASVRRLLGGD